MTNSALGFTASGNGVKAANGIGASDSGAPSAYLWKILNRSSSSVYTFQNKSTGKYISISSTNTSGEAVQLIDSSSDSKAQWRVLQYTGSTESMRDVKVFLQNSHIVPMGSTFDLSTILNNCYYYSHIIGDNGLPVTVSAEAYDGQSSSIAYISGSSLIGYANKAGLVSLKIQFGNGSSPIVKKFSIYFQPPNDTYFYLQNVRLSNGLQYGFVQPHASNTNVIKSEISFSPE